MTALKARLTAYFTRSRVETELFAAGTHDEWHELDLWELWTQRKNTPDGFQDWLDEENPNTPGSARRDTLSSDIDATREQLDEATS